jgi:hypothetical protein
MARGLMYVETSPASPEEEAEYHEWYDHHVRALLDVDGVVTARRYRVLVEEGTFAAVYELDGDLEAVHDRIRNRDDRPEGPQRGIGTDPPPRIRLLELLD